MFLAWLVRLFALDLTPLPVLEYPAYGPTRAPEPAPFFLDGGPTGILLIHGFTGSPPEMRLVGDYLHVAGLTVSAPLLPGHGTAIEDMNRVRWQDWAEHVEAAYQELRSRCELPAAGSLWAACLSAACSP